MSAPAFDFAGMEAPQSDLSGYQYLPLDASGTSSRYCDLLSVLHDQNPDVASKLDAFLRSVNCALWKNVVSTMAILVHEQVPVEARFEYVRPQDRAKSAIVVRTITHTSPLDAVLTAARLHNDVDIARLVSGWTYGQRDVQAIHGGFPTKNEDQLVTEIIDDHSKVVPAASIGGLTNVISAAVHSSIGKNFGLIKQDKPENRARNYVTFKKGASSLEKPVGDMAAKLYALATGYNPKYSQDQKVAQSEFVANFVQAQAAAREALKTGRMSRGTDNHPVITSPWYRFKHAPKNVNRLAFFLAVTGGKIKATSSAQLSKVFPVDEKGWYVHADVDCPLETLVMDLEKKGYLNDFVLAPQTLIQIDILADAKKSPLSLLLKLLQKNKVVVGWALHDGFLFLTSNVGHGIMDAPSIMMRIAAINHVRTLNAHAPWMDLRANVLDEWYGGYINSVLIPKGSFSGFDVGDFSLFGDEKTSKKAKVQPEGEGANMNLDGKD